MIQNRATVTIAPNRNSYAIYRMAPIPMTLNYPLTQIYDCMFHYRWPNDSADRVETWHTDSCLPKQCFSQVYVNVRGLCGSENSRRVIRHRRENDFTHTHTHTPIHTHTYTHKALFTVWKSVATGCLRGTVGRTSVFDRRTFPVLRSTCS